MPKINVLEKSVAELIAAGEVVERPASVIKELVENAIDAGAKHITVEIQRGGVLFMRTADDGCGIAHGDVPLAFLRHATSKILKASDLDEIATLGFRGEALAATCSVAKVELFTKTAEEPFGTHYTIAGGVQGEYEESGCPDGTTILVRDLFYNTPARMKFLKKDVSEGNTVAAVLDRAALSHPEIAFKLIREGKQTLSTAGDGKLESAVYSVLGREFAKSLIPVSGENGGIAVKGLTCKPVYCRQSRAFQFVFLNGRFVRSGTVMAAAEQAYKNSAMVGKFPGYVLNVNIPYSTVDVNVHPAKTEVRFSDERRVFDAVYAAMRAAIAGGDTRPVIDLSAKPKVAPFSHITAGQYRQQMLPQEKNPPAAPPTPVRTQQPPAAARLRDDGVPLILRPEYPHPTGDRSVAITREPEEQILPAAPAPSAQSAAPEPKKTEPTSQATLKATLVDSEIAAANEGTSAADAVSPLQNNPDPAEEIRLVGEAFRTYIVVEKGSSIFLIDKHAAHERVLFEEMKQSRSVETQALLTPLRVTLGKEEYTAVIAGTDLLAQAGFEIEDFGSGSVLVRSVPATLIAEDIPSVISEAAASLCERGSVEIAFLDHLYHTVACKAAIKAGYRTGDAELLSLARRVLDYDDIMYCPHGRPVAFEIKRHDLEKQFGRIQ